MPEFANEKVTFSQQEYADLRSAIFEGVPKITADAAKIVAAHLFDKFADTLLLHLTIETTSQEQQAAAEAVKKTVVTEARKWSFMLKNMALPDVPPDAPKDLS